ncbi:MAG: CDP-glycerol glycerophosphotransferase family protein [Fidelibacterota bacterium]
MSSPITVVFDAYHLYHLPQFDPVIDLLESDDRFGVFLTTSSANLPEEQRLVQRILSHRESPVITAENESERARKIRALKPQVFICGWSRYPLETFVPDSTLVGMAYHGIGVKPSYWLDNHPRLDLRFVEGPYRKRQLREKGIETDLEVTGFAKLDPLFNGRTESPPSVLAKLDLDSTKRTIVYAPTFYPSSVEPFGMKLAENTQDFNLIIKLHTWVYFRKKFGGLSLKHQRRIVEEAERRFSHVRVLPPEFYNIVPLYGAADLLITEASSTIFEMMALDKPVILCRFHRLRVSHRLFRRRLYRKRLSEKMEREVTEFCTRLEHPDDLKDSVDSSLSQSLPAEGKRDAYKKDMLFKLDGKASERIRDHLLDRVG